MCIMPDLIIQLVIPKVPYDPTRTILENDAPDLLPDVLGWWLVVAVGFDLLQTREEVHVLRSDELCLLEHLPEDEQDWEEEDGEVVGDKGWCVPVALEEDRV